MRAFNPLLFRLYASDLEQAILGLSRETNVPPRAWPVRYRTEPQKPMSDETNVTPLPAVELTEAPKANNSVTIAEPLQRSITGASFLGDQISDLLNAIKGEVTSAFQDIQDSAVELRAGINSAKDISKALKGEAAQIKSKLGQFSNFSPD